MPFLETFITYGKREKWFFFLEKKTKCRFVNHVREWFSSRDHETNTNTKEMKKKKTKMFFKSLETERSISTTKIIMRWLATASLTYGYFFFFETKQKLFPGDFLFCKFNGEFIFVAKTFSIVIHHLELWWISFHFVVFL